jgi:calcium-dependent protein kinase
MYDQIRVLGHGGFGVTYEARHKATGQIHALKLILKKNEKVENPKESFEKEVEILSAVAHPGIVGFKGAYEDEKHFCMALEILRGGELFDRITSFKFYTEQTASAMVKNMLRPLCYLHDKNICHLVSFYE